MSKKRVRRRIIRKANLRELLKRLKIKSNRNLKRIIKNR
jgi:hypothetical protein